MTPSFFISLSVIIDVINCCLGAAITIDIYGYNCCISLFLFFSSLSDVPLSPTITSLNLHCNHIPRIEGLTSAWHLQHLDLSSNCISQIEGLGSLTSLRTLNLSCNLITKVEGELSVLLPVNWCHKCRCERTFTSSIDIYFLSHLVVFISALCIINSTLVSPLQDSMALWT